MLRTPDERAPRRDAADGSAALEEPSALPVLPPWVRLADAVALAIVAVWLRVALFAPVRTRVFDVRITITSQVRLAVLLALVLVVRHAIWRRTPLHARVAERVHRWWRTPHSGAVLAAAALSRTAILAVGVLAVASFDIPPKLRRISSDPLTNLASRWDATWYLGIIEWGYEFVPDGRQHNVAFFPALPAGMAALGAMLQWHPLHAGVLLSILAFAAAATYLFRLARESLEPDAALGAVWLLAAYPFSLFYSVPYTESLYLLGVLATIHHFRRSHWGRAATFGVITGLTRPNGCLLSVVLAILVLVDAWRARQEGRSWLTRRTWLQVAVASAPGLGMIAFSAYLYSRFGDPLIWTRVQGAWGRGYTDLVDLAGERAAALHETGLLGYVYAHPLEFMNTAAALFGLAMIVPVWRRLGSAHSAFVALSLIPPLVMGGTTSLGRVSSTLFPVFIVLGAWCSPAWRMSLLVVFGILQGVAAAMFFTWRQMF